MSGQSGHLYSRKAVPPISFLQKCVDVNVGRHLLLGKKKHKKQNKTKLFAAYNIYNLTVLNSSPFCITLWEYKDTDVLTVHSFEAFSEYADIAITVFLIRQERDEYLCIQRMDCIYIHLPTHVYML